MNLRNDVFDNLDSVNIISLPPSEIADVLSIFGRENSTIQELSILILRDAKLTARLLRMANVSTSGKRQDVAGVNRAIEAVGKDKVKALLLPITIYDIIFARDSGYPGAIERLRAHMLETAVVAQKAARIAGYGDVNEAFMAGFLHDFGRMFLLSYFPQEFDEIRRTCGEDRLLIDAERDILETDHQEIGKYIAERWDLPKSLSEVMGNHHPDDITDLDSYPQLARLVMFADNISPSGFDFPDSSVGTARRTMALENCSEIIGFSLEDIKSIYRDLAGDILAVADIFDMAKGDRIEYLSRINREIFNHCFYLAGAIREEQGLPGTLPAQELSGGIHQSLNCDLAKLSHYINNATMNISGQCEILQMLYEQDDRELIHRKLPAAIDSVKSSIRKISLILEELSGQNYIEKPNKIKISKAVDIGSKLKNRPDPTQVPA